MKAHKISESIHHNYMKLFEEKIKKIEGWPEWKKSISILETSRKYETEDVGEKASSKINIKRETKK